MSKAAKKAVVKAGVSVPRPEMIPLAGLNFAPYNPRVMPAAQMAALKRSLVKHGMVLSLVVQRAGNVLIGGHQRVTALRELCAEEGWDPPELVPATVLDVGDAEARQLNVALNRIDGEFDPFRLGELFAGIRAEMTMDDALATGFNLEEIDAAISAAVPVDEEAARLEREAGLAGLEGFARSITLSVEFDTAEQRDEAKALLKEAAGGKMPGKALLRALKGAKGSNNLRERHNGAHATNGKKRPRPSA